MPQRDGCIRTELFRAFLRSKGFSYRKQQEKTELYRSGMMFVNVPRRDYISEDNVRTILRNTLHLSTEEIETFLGTARTC